MKLIVRINSRSNPDAEPRTVVEEAADYETARESVYSALGEDDRVLSLRIDRDDDGVHS